MANIISIQVSDGMGWKQIEFCNVQVRGDINAEIQSSEPIRNFYGSQSIEWTATMDEATAMQIMQFFRPRKNRNVVKRLAARAIINASFNS